MSRNVPAVSATETGQHLAGSGGQVSRLLGQDNRQLTQQLTQQLCAGQLQGRGWKGGYLGASTAADPLNRLRGSSSTAANLQVGLAMLSSK
jgi:hypothetical protein